MQTSMTAQHSSAVNCDEKILVLVFCAYAVAATFWLLFQAALIVTAWNLIGAVARRSTEDIYLSNRYTIRAVLWTLHHRGRRDTGPSAAAGVGRQREFSAHDARTAWRHEAFLCVDVRWPVGRVQLA